MLLPCSHSILVNGQFGSGTLIKSYFVYVFLILNVTETFAYVKSFPLLTKGLVLQVVICPFGGGKALGSIDF